MKKKNLFKDNYLASSQTHLTGLHPGLRFMKVFTNFVLPKKVVLQLLRTCVKEVRIMKSA